MTTPPPCRVCGAATRATLRGRADHEYAVATMLDYWRCTGCALVFADPIPSALIPSFYAAYSTHERVDPTSRSRIWNLIDAVTPALDHAASFDSLDIPRAARILDFGCGAGAFLDELRRKGFSNLAGCDFDPKVAAVALPNLRFFNGIADLDCETFDIITLNHVLEHVEDVVATITKLRSHLNPRGMIYIRTPNARSLLARTFGKAWRGWETPRHLNVLTPEAMKIAVKRSGGLLEMTTSNDMRAGMFMGTLAIGLAKFPTKVTTLLAAAAYVPAAWLMSARRAVDPSTGEELVAIIR